MGPFQKSKNCKYILVIVDYVSKWVETMPCRVANAKNSKKMFEETIFPWFGVSRMVISDGGTHFTDKFTTTCQNMGSITMSLLYTILRQVAKQKHQINKSRTFYKRRSTRGTAWKDRLPDALWAYRMAYKMPLGMSHTNLSTKRPAIDLLS